MSAIRDAVDAEGPRVVLLLDDDERQRRLLEKILTPYGFYCVHAESSDQARKAVATHPAIDLALVDVRLTGESGATLAAELVHEHPGVGVLMVSVEDDPAVVSAIVETGVHGYVVKPFTESQILVSVLNALRIRDLQMQAALAQNATTRAYEAEVEISADLRAVDELKDTVLRAVAHDLRTPLAIIEGFASTLRVHLESMSTQQANGILERIEANTRRLAVLLTDLLDLDRINAGMGESEDDVDIALVAARAVGDIDASSHRVELVIEAGATARVDPHILERMLSNLVGNAVNHTPTGTPIWVIVTGDAATVRISVDDAGPGVPDEQKGDVFGLFSHRTTHTGSFGLGLALVAKFAELYGGRAWVEDRKGGGASFIIELPAAPCAIRPPARPAAPTPLRTDRLAAIDKVVNYLTRYPNLNGTERMAGVMLARYTTLGVDGLAACLDRTPVVARSALRSIENVGAARHVSNGENDYWEFAL